MVAHDPARPIHRIFWQGDSRHILFLQDRAGDENYHLFRVDAGGGTPQELTPGERVKAEILDIDPRFPNDALIASNERDERLFDVHRLDLERGTAQLDTENPGDVSGWLADNDFIVRAAVVQKQDGSSLIRIRDGATVGLAHARRIRIRRRLQRPRRLLAGWPSLIRHHIEGRQCGAASRIRTRRRREPRHSSPTRRTTLPAPTSIPRRSASLLLCWRAIEANGPLSIRNTKRISRRWQAFTPAI